MSRATDVFSAVDRPRLFHDLSREAATQSSTEISDTAQGESEGTLSPEAEGASDEPWMGLL
ncbi:MAG: hypothetical protein GX162_11905 [Firmicutes bacterium]|jgi:hypothetical protein|nr:hypothetical protein [Bacillota bacterium]